MSQAPLHRPLHQHFPPDFVWGVATSSFQIEGAAHVDGKGESIWDRFCKQPGAIADASNGDVACDHFNRLEEDLDLIASLGVNAYRFSIAWPRVQALGHGEFNPKGLDFYERLVDGLKARGIQAWATLNHWDLPQGLQDRGGWNDRDTVHRFVDYARHVQSRIGDRIDGLTTHNEPWVVATLGNDKGIFAPGIKSKKIAAQVSHHLLLSHGLALQALRADGAKSQLGIVLNLSSCVPATAMPADISAASLADSRGRRWYADPLFKGAYPDDVLAELGADAPVVVDGDMAAVAQPMDYLGVNYYTRSVVSAGGEEWDAKGRGLPVSDMDWEIYPQGLTDLLVLLKHDYAKLPPVYVTENGGAFKDDMLVGGRVQDDDRTAYLRDHIAAVASAMQQGVPMAGYMVWSLMDNFEWASGYLKRFGIVHVDYATQARTPKASADWYRGFLRNWRG
ncbi:MULTISPECIES: GH1 family beta-glucosidase [unclassified Roseateles]|uniref:GH1 family beta-glucosidase n=1 Tax=unclassified Roseateles TaxID=2626991 RepID=UPI0006F5E9A7|nr:MULTISPECIES: GH1 family beta-glucosidase [unclassified Roseateles]KQW42939.1 beta-glucosidase [Pelomonas sp. Root405]KRA69617.1 beta-glucosidase [Pelomonas sp. Root662]